MRDARGKSALPLQSVEVIRPAFVPRSDLGRETAGHGLNYLGRAYFFDHTSYGMV